MGLEEEIAALIKALTRTDEDYKESHAKILAKIEELKKPPEKEPEDKGFLEGLLG